IWKSRETNKHEWTSLRGNDRKKLLLKLPPAIPDIIPGDNGDKIKKIWMAHQWIKDFINIKLDGHSKANITPYMQIKCCHVPNQMKRYNGIKRYSGQGTCICIISIMIINMPNHMDAPKEVLITEARIDQLSTNQRQKREYRKRNTSYWSNEIYLKRQK
uniref:Uncharacterized protein n=1 Tax=Amphimedon queenslandica TaxID=400682 RepID=A0A1X7USZ2_AMPQE